MKYDSNVIKSTTPQPRWQDLVRQFQTPDTLQGIWQVLNTIIPFFAMFYLMYRSMSYSYWLTLLIALPTAGFSVRTFIIQHDCGHGSFFSSSKANDLVGTFCGFLSIIPYYQWRHEHAIHHATSGDLSRRGIGDVNMVTVDEYLAMTRWQRIYYGIYRNPLVMTLIGPTYIFGLASRFVGKHSGAREKRNVYLTNVVILGQIIVWSMLIGFKTFMMIWAPVFLIAGAVGIWLFYVQHQYEGTYWKRTEEWDYATSALQGSSYYKLPRILQWFTGNIGFHHIHHLSPKIPNYKLQRCHEQTPLFQNVKTFGIRESFKSASLRLWDEENQRMVGFDHLRSAAK